MASSKTLPTSYADALAALDGCYSRKIMHNTYARSAGERVEIVLHSTAVVEFHSDGRIVLNTGGWRTVTTKDRLNRCLPYPWRVWSDARKGGWGLYENGTRVTHYSDGMELRPDSSGVLRPWRGGVGSQPKMGQPCSCRRGIERDNCPQCEGTGQRIDFAAIRKGAA